MRANYAGNVSLIDEQIGAILRVLEARGELQNTVIAFTSDHGELNGDHGLIYKSTFLEGCVRVPLLLRTPQTAARNGGAACPSPVEWHDVGATLAELAGGELPWTQFGRSLVPTLTNPQTSHRTEALSEINGEIMIRSAHWKAAVNRHGQLYLLFDLRHDPREQTNLADDPAHRDQANAMRARILQRLVDAQIHAC